MGRCPFINPRLGNRLQQRRRMKPAMPATKAEARAAIAKACALHPITKCPPGKTSSSHGVK